MFPISRQSHTTIPSTPSTSPTKSPGCASAASTLKPRSERIFAKADLSRHSTSPPNCFTRLSATAGSHSAASAIPDSVKRSARRLVPAPGKNTSDARTHPSLPLGSLTRCHVSITSSCSPSSRFVTDWDSASASFRTTRPPSLTNTVPSSAPTGPTSRPARRTTLPAMATREAAHTARLHTARMLTWLPSPSCVSSPAPARWHL